MREMSRMFRFATKWRRMWAGRWVLLLPSLAVLAGCVEAERPAVSLLAEADRQQIASTRQEALENSKVGESVNWSNDETGHLGTVTPTRTYYADSGEPCRDYQETATVEGKTDIYFGSACRNADGVWTEQAESAYDRYPYSPPAGYYGYSYYDYYPPIHPGYPYFPYFYSGFGYRHYGHYYGPRYGRYYYPSHRAHGYIGFSSSFGY